MALANLERLAAITERRFYNGNTTSNYLLNSA